MVIRFKPLIVTCASAVLLGPLLFVSPAGAAAFTVNSTADGVDASPGNGVCATAGGVCTLRAAVMEANAQAAANPGTANQITVPGGVYTLTGVKGENGAATGDLDVNGGTLTITGAGIGSTVIDANNVDRAFHLGPVVPTRFTLTGATVQNGNAESGDTSTAGADIGGSIRVERNSGLAVSNALFQNNRSGSRGGAIGMPPNAATTAGADPAIITTLTDVIIRNNTAVVEGGGFFSNRGAVLTRVTVDSNTVTGTAGTERGAGISNSGDLTFNDSTVRNNSMVSGFGGGISNRGDPMATPQVFGTIRLNNANVVANSSPQGGGIVNGNGATAILTNTNIHSNRATGPSQLPPIGGFGNLGTADLTNVNIVYNSAPVGGAGGIGTVGNAPGSLGPGSPNAQMTLRNSVLYSNSPRNCLQPPPSFVRPAVNAGGNFSSDATCGF